MTIRSEVGKGLARIDTKTMKELGVKETDIIQIEGHSKYSVAMAIKHYPADVDLKIIRIDGLMRFNSGTSLGEYVTIRKAVAKDANLITLEPANKGVFVYMSEKILKRNLYMRPMVLGDIIVPMPVIGRRAGGFAEDFSSERVFEVAYPSDSETRLSVVKTVPEGIVTVTEETAIELRNIRKYLEDEARPDKEELEDVIRRTVKETIGQLSEKGMLKS